MKNEYMGQLVGETTYCNEKIYDGTGFLFKCNKDCEHHGNI